MRKVLFIVTLSLATFAFFIHLMVGAIDRAVTAQRPPVTTSQRPPAEWDQGAYEAARAYAEYCGGIVTDPLGQYGGPYVINHNCEEK